MKIRWYHWWVYNLFYWVWTPIYKSHPEMVAGTVKHMTIWLKTNNYQVYNNSLGKFD